MSASRHEGTASGWAAASEQEKFNSPEAIARSGDIMIKEGPIVAIGPRSVFVNPVVGG